jgi:hypothetical protein
MFGKTGDDLNTFLDLLAVGLRPDERLVGAAFAGDPKNRHGWLAEEITRQPDGSWNMPGNASLNRYICVSAFHQAEDGSWRRRKEDFAAGVALMVDDVGDLAEAVAEAEEKNKQAVAAGKPPEHKPSVKADWSVLDGWKPTALIETSKGNFQVWFVLDEPCRDLDKFERLLGQFVTVRGGDKSCTDVARPARTPESRNCKKKCREDGSKGWDVVVHHLDGDRYSMEDLEDIFELNLTVPYRRPAPQIDDEAAQMLEAHFYRCVEVLKAAGMVKRWQRSPRWIQITCINVDNHTNRKDDGTALAIPSDKNGWTGAYDCKHDSCATLKDARGERVEGVGIGWREFTDWVDEQIAPQLNKTNAANAAAVPGELFNDC